MKKTDMYNGKNINNSNAGNNNSSTASIDQRTAKQAWEHNLAHIFDVSNLEDSEDSSSEDPPQKQIVFQYANWPLYHNSNDETVLVTSYIGDNVNNNPLYKRDFREFHYNKKTSICYIKYRDISYLMGKQNTVMSNYTYSGDGSAGIIVFTNGSLFQDLIRTNRFECEKGSRYLKKMKLCYPTEDGDLIFSIPKFVLFMYGHFYDIEKDIHHEENRRNNTIEALECEYPYLHKEIHDESRLQGIDFNDDSYILGIIGTSCATEEEARMIEKNLNFIVTILPFFKGIKIDDNLDLTVDIRYLSFKELLNYITVY